MFSNAESQLIYKVANAPIRMYPYPHILVHDVFPADFYRTLREHLPPPNAYKTLTSLGRVSGNYPDTRVVLPLTKPAVADLAEPYRGFWDDTSRWLLGGFFGQSVLQKFGPLFGARFANPATVQFQQESLVIQDRTNYSLGPHTDAPRKVVSLLFYLPADASMPHLGTSMYLPRNPSFTCPGGPHYPGTGFQRLLTMPYVPNTLFGFLKTPNSFHGVEPIVEPAVERALMLFDIYAEESMPAPAPAPTKPHTQFSF